MVKIYHGCILHSKRFPTTPHTPKSELKQRSYGPDKLDKENCRDRENSIVTKFYVAQSKLCRDRVFSVTIEKNLSR